MNLNNLYQKWLLGKQPKESCLYHYTGYDGFLGIINTSSIWATNIHYLNDSTEFNLAINVARKVLDAKKCNRIITPIILEIINTIEKSLDNIEKMGVYICSFSEDGDLLSQWRGYCHDGNGVALGLDAEKLINLARINRFNANDSFFLAPCYYDSHQHEAIIKELLDEFITFYSRSINDSEENRVAYINILIDHFRVFGPIIKHRSFQEEKEWRLIAANISDNDSLVQIRQRKSTLLPYINFKLCDSTISLPLEAVVVGPNQHPDLAEQSVKAFIGKHGIDNNVVRRTSIPYRNW